MPTLNPGQYPVAQPLFENLSAYHLCGWAVLCGTAPGEVWLDDLDRPRVGVVESSEGCYLAGDPGHRQAHAAIREVIPPFAYLICDPPEWEQALPLVWSNPAARRHERQHYVFRASAAPGWRGSLPSGMRMRLVDRDFFELEYLQNFRSVADWVGGWRSREDFLERGVGAVIVQGDTIASWSVMDCALNDRCEIGVMTAMGFRRQGLAKAVVSAVLEACLARGYHEVGWQCLRNNKGSVATALAVGFKKERDYLAFSDFLPAESAGDMTAAEYSDWAEHYEHFLPEPTWAFMAVQAWSLAGRPDRAVENLRHLHRLGWKSSPEWIVGYWRLNGLRGNEEAEWLMKEITGNNDETVL